ncbi:UbiH/UbiF/VisC/COQ6 family ubiquinone biosynthesis hydroxylase [Carnimonas nigrificans]|uniref:UbiH/UbiF/VisC/COQ6 family ubiquinone biosynthesis hydroxylase n=1 Tax=Carnimonas nigrificans TaxID=64323 RepID=UPI0004B1B68A|nr:UbiH/UbiF/VisC/COQ6 family ubiquinone biosynthesis hydroxylase [Carnimonas nigrificans]
MKDHSAQPSNKVLESEVAIVGAGMVGATLALLLAEAGISVALIDAGEYSLRWKKAQLDNRVSAITAASRALFTSLGVWPDIAKRRIAPYQHMQVWDSEGLGEINFSASDVAASELGHIVENSAIVDALNEALAKNERVTGLFGHQVTALEWYEPEDTPRPYTEGKRSLTLDDGRQVVAPLVVGADGGRSMVRRMAAMEVNEYPTGQQAIVASVHHQLSHDNTARQVFLPTGPLAFLPIASPVEGEYWSSIVWSADSHEADRLRSLNDDEFAGALREAFEGRVGDILELRGRASFPLVQRHVRRYTLPGLALVGDAAHSLHPLAGQGANLGFLDVAVLAEELARAHQRGAALGDERVLERYARRRRMDNSAMLKLMDGFRLGFGSRQPLVRMARNLGLRSIDRFAPVKQAMIHQALGYRHDLPERMKRQTSL